MKKLLSIILVTLLIAGLFAGCTKEPAATPEVEPAVPAVSDVPEETPAVDGEETAAASTAKIVWYAPAPHPYFDEVQKGVEKFVADTGVEVSMQIGPDWTQASQNEKVEALVAQGYNAISIYPADASGANGLYEEITVHGVNVINFGSNTNSPTPASFAVATDVKQAAYDATVALIEMMGEKGNIINVLEVLEDPNTTLRKEGIEEAVAKYPDVTIIQEVAGIKNQEEAVEKIESVISAHQNDVDGIICTGMVTSVGLVQTLSSYYEQQPDTKHIFTIGIDTDPGVMKGIEEGIMDATIAQNSAGHGYISCMILNLMGQGYTPVESEYFVDSGIVVVTKANIDSYSADIDKVTEEILSQLTTKYLTK